MIIKGDTPIQTEFHPSLVRSPPSQAGFVKLLFVNNIEQGQTDNLSFILS